MIQPTIDYHIYEKFYGRSPQTPEEIKQARDLSEFADKVYRELKAETRVSMKKLLMKVRAA